MKILVFSDSHGNTKTMMELVERHKPDRILHLGDVVRDAYTLREAFPDIPLDLVRGNCDGWLPEPEELHVTLEGRKLFLCHGHTYHVKYDWGEAAIAARAEG
ncbi:metallophosphoesterase family protein, partial [Pseudoflavonifractor phocaeensis]